jgi:hypothetical protein
VICCRHTVALELSRSWTCERHGSVARIASVSASCWGTGGGPLSAVQHAAGAALQQVRASACLVAVQVASVAAGDVDGDHVDGLKGALADGERGAPTASTAVGKHGWLRQQPAGGAHSPCLHLADSAHLQIDRCLQVDVPPASCGVRALGVVRPIAIDCVGGAHRGRRRHLHEGGPAEHQVLAAGKHLRRGTVDERSMGRPVSSAKHRGWLGLWQRAPAAAHRHLAEQDLQAGGWAAGGRRAGEVEPDILDAVGLGGRACRGQRRQGQRPHTLAHTLAGRATVPGALLSFQHRCNAFKRLGRLVLRMRCAIKREAVAARPAHLAGPRCTTEARGARLLVLVADCPWSIQRI